MIIFDIRFLKVVKSTIQEVLFTRGNGGTLALAPHFPRESGLPKQFIDSRPRISILILPGRQYLLAEMREHGPWGLLFPSESGLPRSIMIRDP